MSWFTFYLIGFMFMFFATTELVKYEEFPNKRSKIIYVISVLILSAFSWLSILLCIYGAYVKNDK